MTRRFAILWAISLGACSGNQESEMEPLAVVRPAAGVIQSSAGTNCEFTQRTERMARIHSLPGDTHIVTFTDPRCMSASSDAGDTNRSQIAQAVSTWHSFSDAEFRSDTSELYRTSPLQVRGSCIQSKRYPSYGIAIEFTVRDGYFVEVFHIASAGACED